MQPVLRQTKNYEMFELHRFNRDIRNINRLVKSMRRHGFSPHKSISCVKNGSGKLVVTDGHHRLVAAKEIDIPVWYTLAENTGMTIQEEQLTTRPWDLKDYLTSYVRNGIHGYRAVEKYMEETGIPLGLSISLLAGESAGSGNKTSAFKAGTFSVGDRRHADQVKSIVLTMKKYGISFATNSFLVQAISKVLWVDSFSVSRFKTKIKSHAQSFEKQPNLQAYLEAIERLYNRQSKDRLPVAFLACEKSKERHLNFG